MRIQLRGQGFFSFGFVGFVSGSTFQTFYSFCTGINIQVRLIQNKLRRSKLVSSMLEKATDFFARSAAFLRSASA